MAIRAAGQRYKGSARQPGAVPALPRCTRAAPALHPRCTLAEVEPFRTRGLEPRRTKTGGKPPVGSYGSDCIIRLLTCPVCCRITFTGGGMAGPWSRK
ncbi:hypothetical protein [Streptomyces nigrescens]